MQSLSAGDFQRFSYGYNSNISQASNEGAIWQWVNVVNSVSATMGAISGVVSVSGTVDVSGTVAITGTTGSAHYPEDTRHFSGDKGVQILAVRNDSNGTITSDDGDYSPVSVDSAGRVAIYDGGTSVTIDGTVSVVGIANEISGVVSVSGPVAVSNAVSGVFSVSGAVSIAYGGSVINTSGTVNNALSGVFSASGPVSIVYGGSVINTSGTVNNAVSGIFSVSGAVSIVYGGAVINTSGTVNNAVSGVFSVSGAVSGIMSVSGLVLASQASTPWLIRDVQNFPAKEFTTQVFAYNSSGTGVGEISNIVFLNSAVTVGTLTMDYATIAGTTNTEIIRVYRSYS